MTGYTTEEVSRGTGAATKPAPAASAVTAALTPVVSFSARSQFRIRAASWARKSTGGPTEGAFWIVGEIDPQTRKLPAWAAGSQADVAIVGADGAQVVSEKIDVKPGSGAFAIQVPESGGVPAGDYTVRVRLRSPAAGELGLSDTARVAIKEGSTLGEAVLLRRGPSTGPQYQRTADPRFQRRERLRLELATTVTESAAARVLDRTGSAISLPVEITERQDPSMAFTWIVIDLALAPLAAADYAVEVTQAESKQLTAFRVVP